MARDGKLISLTLIITERDLTDYLVLSDMVEK